MRTAERIYKNIETGVYDVDNEVRSPHSLLKHLASCECCPILSLCHLRVALSALSFYRLMVSRLALHHQQQRVAAGEQVVAAAVQERGQTRAVASTGGGPCGFFGLPAAV